MVMNTQNIFSKTNLFLSITVLSLCACGGSEDDLITRAEQGPFTPITEVVTLNTPEGIVAQNTNSQPGIDLDDVTFTVKDTPALANGDCLQVNPKLVNFGNVTPGAYHSRSISVVNVCDVDVRILDAKISSDSSSRFSIEGGEVNRFVIKAKEAYEVSVGLAAFSNKQNIVSRLYPGGPIILQNSYQGGLEIDFIDARIVVQPLEVFTASVNLKGIVDVQTSPEPIERFLDPRLQQMKDFQPVSPGPELDEFEPELSQPFIPELSQPFTY